MMRPCVFGFNPETSASNAFQHQFPVEDLTVKVQSEFDHVLQQLRAEGLEVHCTQSVDERAPDAIFPNNWFSTHHDGSLVLYPMMAVNRRRERESSLLDELRDRFCIDRIIDLRSHELEGRFLEGTGSVVFDHEAAIAYAVLSPRTDRLLLEDLCHRLHYRPVHYHSTDAMGMPFYHTNVVMFAGSSFVVYCPESIRLKAELEMLERIILESGKIPLALSLQQVSDFCGNMLQVRNAAGDLLTICSGTAWSSLLDSQKELISTGSRFVVVDIPLIEKIGGGGIRCMLAEVFLAHRPTASC
ncbi:MAG: amidinotransferase [Bacteroidia bacterium]|nr:amidinotransferase [Bacteroidia bacterium]